MATAKFGSCSAFGANDKTLSDSGNEAVFPEEEFVEHFDPVTDGPALGEEVGCDGLLIDTFHKDIGRGLLDYYSKERVEEYVDALHAIGKEAWIAGSITQRELLELWSTEVDVICVRGAACSGGSAGNRFGEVREDIVARLLATAH